MHQARKNNPYYVFMDLEKDLDISFEVKFVFNQCAVLSSLLFAVVIDVVSSE